MVLRGGACHWVWCVGARKESRGARCPAVPAYMLPAGCPQAARMCLPAQLCPPMPRPPVPLRSTMLATELAVLQAGGAANGPAFAAMAARLQQQQQQDMRRLSDASRSHSSHGGSLRSSVAAGGSVGSSTTGPCSPTGGSGRGHNSSGRGHSSSGRGHGGSGSGRGTNGGMSVLTSSGRAPPDTRSS